MSKKVLPYEMKYSRALACAAVYLSIHLCDSTVAMWHLRFLNNLARWR